MKTESLLSDLKKNNGVFYSETAIHDSDFNQQYFEIRKKEGRIFSDQLLKQLPELNRSHPHFKEFKIRKGSALRLIRYLKKNNANRILDIGCGNGWMSNLLAQIMGSEIFALDTVKEEIEQAARVFTRDNLHFIYADLNTFQFKNGGFDKIILSASVQYFENLPALFRTLFPLLNSDGEIHIIDSPIYWEKEIEAAEKRTLNYYSEYGYPGLGKFYFHHSRESFVLQGGEWMYTPSLWKNKFQAIFPESGFSPFPWVRFKKNN